MKKREKGFVSLIELVIGLLAICALCYFSFGKYLKSSPTQELSPDTQEILASHGIEVSTQKAALETVNKKVGEINQRQDDYNKLLNDAAGQGQ